MNEKPRGFEPRGFDTVISPLIVSASALYRQRKTLRAIARLIVGSQTKKPRGSKPRGLAKSIAMFSRQRPIATICACRRLVAQAIANRA